MHWYSVVALLLTVSALFSFLNYKFFRLPKTVGLMLISLASVFGLFGLRALGLDVIAPATVAVQSVDFSETLLQGVLSFLLFAGALHIDISEFLEEKWSIGVLASVGVVVSAFVIGVGTYYLFPLCGFSLPFLLCLLFGALISPTDPVATLALLKTSRVPQSIKMKIAGEALFNDGTGVVFFIVVFTLLSGVAAMSPADVATLFIREAVGGIIYGFAIGYGAFQLIRRVDDYQVEILLSLALVAGGYALASLIHVSGPLAMVVAGLFMGNHGRKYGMSEKTRNNLDTFWNVIDDVLNVILFVLVGFEALLINVKLDYVLAGLVVIPIVLIGRFLSVCVSAQATRPLKQWSTHAVTLLTWGGLRGGVSFALALALPQGDGRDALILVTYMVVIFSVLVQGLTMSKLVKKTETIERSSGRT
ncbi:MAG TPA: sodium:proton antiporter [Candidatus Paceibacterota bacterium]